jgi:acetyl esterase/lipase
VIGLGVLVALAWVWPARRNHYFQQKDVERRLDVPYVAGGTEPKQRLDLYLPHGGGALVPIVVFVHGGYWSAMDRRMFQPLLGTYGNVGVALARKGIAAALVGYRQHPLARSGDDSLADIAAAVRFVRASCPSWGCDDKRVFLVGHSAGGHLVSLLALDERAWRGAGTSPEDLAGFVSIDGIFDLGASLASFKPDQAAIVRQLFGPDDATLAAHSTISHARAHHPPLLFVDSTGDEPVCLDGFRRMKEVMAKAGSPAAFVELPGLGHNEAIIHVGMDDDLVLPVLLRFITSGA